MGAEISNDPRGVRRVAMVSVHTSPLALPGTGDAGGMNVYILEVSRQLVRRGVEVEIFTRRTAAAQPPIVQLEPGLIVRHVDAGPYEGLDKEDLPGQLCAFAAGMMRVAAVADAGHYDLVHAHYWLSGQVAWLAADRWNVPLVHTMHTMARVKNEHLAPGDVPEPIGREIGESQVVEAAERLVANTATEAEELIRHYGADPRRVSVVHPGVDPQVFQTGDRDAARRAHGIREDAVLLLFVGRIQRLKAPDVLLRAAAVLLEADESLRERLVIGILGGASGHAVRSPMGLAELAVELGVAENVRFVPPTSREVLAQWYRAADVVAVPSHNESFGLVAVEAQACGALVVAADVGGLPTAVGEGGILVPDHDPATWAEAIAAVLADPRRAADLRARAIGHAAGFTWEASAQRLCEVYGEAMTRSRDVPINASRVLTGIPAAVVP